MPREVMFYHSQQTGAPRNTGAHTEGVAGAVLDILYACLVTGFNTVSVTSLAHAAGVATCETAAPHNFKVGEWVDFEGAVQSAWNSRFKVLTVPDATHFTFSISAGTTTPATGTITVKYGPAGWTREFHDAGNFKSIFRTKVGSSKGHYFQVENQVSPTLGQVSPAVSASASYLRQRWIEGATGFDAGTYLQTNGTIQYNGSSGLGASSAHWALVADHKTCYLLFTSFASVLPNGASSLLAFGEFQPSSVGDAYPNFCTAYGSNSSNSRFFPLFIQYQSGQLQAQVKLMREYQAIGGEAVAHQGMLTLGALSGSMSFLSSRRWPDPLTGDILFTPVHLFEQNNVNNLSDRDMVYRGRLRGLLLPLSTPTLAAWQAESNRIHLQNVNYEGVDRDVVMFMHGQNISSDTNDNRQALAFDLSDTWG